MIFDTHAHYDDKAFDSDRDELLKSLKANGISKVCNVGARLEGSRNSIELAEKYDFIYAAVGIHPDDCGDMDESWTEELRKMAAHNKVVAIGEIGLDYRMIAEAEDKEAYKRMQKEVFVPQLELANRLDKPIVIHDCEADEDFLEIFDAHPFRGMIHRFFSELRYGREILERGLYLGIGPQITYPNSQKLLDIVKEMPADRLLLETDAPFLPTYPLECRATSDMIEAVCEKIAEVRGDMTPDEAAAVAYENAKKLFDIG